MKIIQPKNAELEKYQKEIEYFSKKCKLEKSMERKIMQMSEKYKLAPSRIIETIVLNVERSENGPRIDDSKINSYKIAIETFKANKKILEKKIREKELVKKNNEGKIKKILNKIKEKFDPDKRELEYLKRKIERYENIKNIITEAQTEKEMIKRLVEKSGFKTLDELWY